LEAVDDEVLRSLCPGERARGGRFPGEHDGQLWQRAHGLLRTLAGRYLERDPGTLRFDRGAQGKPELEQGRAGGSRLSFNLSHSGTLALYAFSVGAEVGVDVEVARRPLDEVAIAARLFGPAEARRLQGLDRAEREQEFLRAWVCKEAELKCRGSGFGADRADAGEDQAWIAELAVGPRAAAAVAAEQSPVALRYLEWTAEAGETYS